MIRQTKQLKMAVDFFMLLLLPILMAYSLIGEAAHEWLGMLMFLLFLLHHLLNWRWFKNLTKGKYSPYRIGVTIINLLLIVVMISLPVSGIVMAKYTFSFVQTGAGASKARLIHLLASYWGYLLMSVHLGFHWNFVKGRIRIICQWKGWRIRVVTATFAGYGIFAFFKRGFWDYLLLQSQFVFFDYNEPLILFFFDYFAIMWLFAFIGYCFAKLCQTIKQQ